MKQDLQDKLVDILTGIQGAVSKGSDFVLTQLPDVAQSYIAFGRAWSFVDLAFAIAILSIGLYALKRGLQSKSIDSYGDWEMPKIFSIIGGILTSGIGLVGTSYSMKNLLLVWFAPKVWLLMEIADLVKGHK